MLVLFDYTTTETFMNLMMWDSHKNYGYAKLLKNCSNWYNSYCKYFSQN